MKKLILLSLLFLFHPILGAQTQVSYLYDSAGNRISRTIVLDRQAVKQNENPTPIVAEIEKNLKVSIYPNPTKGALVVEITGIDSETEKNLSIYSINGTLIQSSKFKNDYLQVDMSSYSEGTYIMRLIINEKNLEYKIVKH